MQIRKILLAVTACVIFAAPALAQFPGTGGGGSHGSDSNDDQNQSESNDSSSNTNSNAGKDDEKNKTSAEAAGQWEMPPTELDLPVDDRVKVRVEPYVAGSVVDRISEPAAVTVQIPDCLKVEVFVVAVDAPYGGKAIEKPRLIGKDDKPADGFKVMWTGKEKTPYVKVFAVITKRAGVQRLFRSHTLDFGMAGTRLDAAAGPKPAATTGSNKAP
jgi:hypothetical protein